jgi:hypothetical protein
MSTTTSLDALTAQIIDSLRNGIPFDINYDEIVESAQDPDSPVISVFVDLSDDPVDLSTFSQLGGFFSGQSVTAVVPNGVLPSGVMYASQAAFTLIKDTQTVSSMSCQIVFDPDNDGLEWVIATINSAVLAVKLQTMQFSWTSPLSDNSFLEANVTGSWLISNLELDVNVAFPKIEIQIQQPDNVWVNVDEFFTKFGFPSVDWLAQINMTGLQFLAVPNDSSFEISSTLITEEEEPVVLIPGTTIPIMAMNEMFFSFSYAVGTTASTISADLAVCEYLLVNIQLDYNSIDGCWKFSGGIDVPGTFDIMHPDAAEETTPIVTVSDLCLIFLESDSYVPDSLANIGIEVLEIDYTYCGGEEDSTYSFYGVFSGDWDIGGGLSATLTALLGSETNEVSASFIMNGFEFECGYTFSDDSNIIFAKIPQLYIEGEYDIDSTILTVEIGGELKFGDILLYFVRSITGNKFFNLGSPWIDALNYLAIPSGTMLTLDITNKTGKVDFNLDDELHWLGQTISGVSISYDSSAAKNGKSGLDLGVLGDFPILGYGTKEVTWDPGTEQAPTIPGQGAAILDVRLLGIGQHIGFKVPAPETVEEAVSDLAVALTQDWSDGAYYPSTMEFSKDIGWLVGAHIIIMEQIDIQFIFSDPSIYGLVLNVTEGSNATLNLLAGLYAEILYRKVSDTVGQYSGTLVLPDSIRQIDYGTVKITLPTLSVDIYTNGNYKIDVGFPYNRDFSRSFSVQAGKYAGAGGVYYAKLDGLSPSSVPQVDDEVGVFSPITELGIGFSVGTIESVNSGPLSASFSITLEALFEGVFATYTRNSDGATQEYFSIDATLAIVGNLTGKIDFVIITASVEVIIYIQANLKLIASRKTQVSIEAYVSVKVTVKIKCGFFKVKIHCSFKTTITTSASFGANEDALWDTDSSTQRIYASESYTVQSTDFNIGWQPIETDKSDTSNQLQAYFIPQLTGGLAYPNPADETPYWYYVGQLALSNPNGELTGGAESYADFVSGMLRWALYAIDNTSSSETVPSATADEKEVSQAQVQSMLDTLAGGSSLPDQDNVQQQFYASFETNMSAPGEELAEGVGIGFFPIIPGMIVSIQADESAERVMTTKSVQNGTKLRTYGGLSANTVQSNDSYQADAIDDVQEQVLIDYTLMAVQAALQQVIDLADFWATEDETHSIGEILDTLTVAELSGISGQTSRFMLNGTRQPESGSGTDNLEPLYALTGQQEILTTEDLNATNLAMKLTAEGTTAADWGITFPNGGTSITESSADEYTLMWAPSQIPEVPTIDADDAITTEMVVAQSQDQRFYLKIGIDSENEENVTMWTMPNDLESVLSRNMNTGQYFNLFQITDEQLGAGEEGSEVSNDEFKWALSVEFRVGRISVPDGVEGGTTQYLSNTYVLTYVDQSALLQLEDLIRNDPDGNNIEDLEVSYQTGSDDSSGNKSLMLYHVDFEGIFIVQSNFSTETNPPQQSANTRVAEVAEEETLPYMTFVNRIYTGGITNSGGYYLYFAQGSGDETGLPDSMFPQNEDATLTMTISFKSQSIVPPYATTVRTVGFPATDETDMLYAASPDIQTTQPTMNPGYMGINVFRPIPVEDPNDDTYGNSLDQLYNIITGSVDTIDGVTQVLSGLPAAFGPQEDDDNSEEDEDTEDPTEYNYSHIFPLISNENDWCADDGDALPPEDENPYRYIGQEVTFNLEWTDIYGNILEEVTKPTEQLIVKYYDHMMAPTQLPYLSLEYNFTSDDGGVATMIVFFNYTPPTYVADSDTEDVSDYSTIKVNDLATYANAWYQLDQTLFAVDSWLETTLNPDVVLTVDTDTIRDNIAAVYEALCKIEVGGAAGDTLDLRSLSVEVSQDVDVLNDNLYFALETTLTLYRQGPIDPSVSDDELVRQVSIEIPAQMIATGTGDATEDNPQALQAFATEFEIAFLAEDFKLMVGAGWETGAAASEKQLWGLRYGTEGVEISFSKDITLYNYFAPKPLANQLQTADVEVQTLDDDGNLTGTSTVAVKDIDLDAEMRRFLTAVDQIFSPEYSVPTALVNTEALNSLTDSKKALVEELVKYVTNLENGAVYEGSDIGAPIDVGTEKYRQECLITLMSFYDMASVVTLPVSAEFKEGLTVEDLNLFGHPVQTDETGSSDLNETDDAGDSEFSLTTGKALLQNEETPIAIGLFAKNQSLYKLFVAKLEFEIDSFEQGVEKLDVDGTDYYVGSWLSFVNAPDALEIFQEVQIPIPLRSFPQPPQLSSQSAVNLLKEDETGEDADSRIQLAKSWSLNGAFNQEYVAQDKVFTDVQINLGLDFSADYLAAEAQKNLMAALVDFNTNYPTIEAIFAAEDLTEVQTYDQTGDTLLSNTLNSFATLVDEVVNSDWSARDNNPSTPADESAEIPQYQSKYQIEEGFEDYNDDTVWRVKVSLVAKNGENDYAAVNIVPQMELEGYKTVLAESGEGYAIYEYLDSDGEKLEAELAFSLTSKVVLVSPYGGLEFDEGTPLNIIDRQNGLLSMMIQRNGDLPDVFHYETPWITYKTKICPLFDVSEEINVNDLSTSDAEPSTLTEHLHALFNSILQGSGTNDQVEGSFLATCWFAYQVESTSANLSSTMVRLPITMRLPSAMLLQPSEDVPDYVTEMAAQIDQWFVDNDISETTRPDLWETSQLDFDISVFTNMTQTGQPILRLRTIVLDCSSLADS